MIFKNVKMNKPTFTQTVIGDSSIQTVTTLILKTVASVESLKAGISSDFDNINSALNWAENEVLIIGKGSVNLLLENGHHLLKTTSIVEKDSWSLDARRFCTGTVALYPKNDYQNNEKYTRLMHPKVCEDSSPDKADLKTHSSIPILDHVLIIQDHSDISSSMDFGYLFAIHGSLLYFTGINFDGKKTGEINSTGDLVIHPDGCPYSEDLSLIHILNGNLEVQNCTFNNIGNIIVCEDSANLFNIHINNSGSNKYAVPAIQAAGGKVTLNKVYVCQHKIKNDISGPSYNGDGNTKNMFIPPVNKLENGSLIYTK